MWIKNDETVHLRKKKKKKKSLTHTQNVLKTSQIINTDTHTI